MCSKVTESEIQHFIHCIEKSRNVKYLRFLQTIVKGGKGSRRAQEMVMNEVRRKRWKEERGRGREEREEGRERE